VIIIAAKAADRRHSAGVCVEEERGYREPADYATCAVSIESLAAQQYLPRLLDLLPPAAASRAKIPIQNGLGRSFMPALAAPTIPPSPDPVGALSAAQTKAALALAYGGTVTSICSMPFSIRQLLTIGSYGDLYRVRLPIPTRLANSRRGEAAPAGSAFGLEPRLRFPLDILQEARVECLHE
jgi:hypothetical protein